VPGSGYLEDLPALVEEIEAEAISVHARRAALADVEAMWNSSDISGERTVLVP